MRVATLSLMVLLAALGPLAAQATGGVEYRLRRAERLMDQLNYRFAIKHLEQTAKDHPDDGRVDVLLGECLFAVEDWRGAVAAYERGFSKNAALIPHVPNHPYALVKLGRLDDAEGSYRRLFEKATEDAQRAQGAYGLGLVAEYRGETEVAVEHYERAWAFDGRSMKIGYRLGVALRRAGRIDDAIRCLEAVLERDGLHLAAAHNLALAYVQKKDRESALRWKERHERIQEARRRLSGLRAALVQKPGDAQLLEATAQLLFENGSYEAALGPCRATTAAQGGAAVPRFRYARCLLALERFKEAREQLEQVIRLAPDNLEAKRLHAQILEDIRGETAPEEEDGGS